MAEKATYYWQSINRLHPESEERAQAVLKEEAAARNAIDTMRDPEKSPFLRVNSANWVAGVLQKNPSNNDTELQDHDGADGWMTTRLLGAGDTNIIDRKICAELGVTLEEVIQVMADLEEPLRSWSEASEAEMQYYQQYGLSALLAKRANNGIE